ncbi:MAG: ATP-dependent DNA ligase [Nitrospirota bacterium]
MTFSQLVSTFEKIEATSKRLEMFAILSDLFKEADTNEIAQIIYLLKGELLPAFHDINIGMSEKYLLRTIANTTGIASEPLLKQHQILGDIGKTAAQFILKKECRNPTISEVYSAIYQMAMMNGEGSVDQKIDALSHLFSCLSPVEAKYVARFVAGQLRLGSGDATILEALALSQGSRTFRPALDRAYNLISDLGLLAKIYRQEGEAGVLAIAVRCGYPIRSALCERLPSAEEIIEKIGRCSVEIKYDGFRCQAHKKENEVILFSRNQERTTLMFPEIVEAIQSVFHGHDIILEGEALAVNETTGEAFPFQVTMQRKRKHDIALLAKTVPLKFFLFDLLYLDGEDYTQYPYHARRNKLISLLPKHPVLEISEAIETEDPNAVSLFFNDVVERGYEGIVAKRLESLYTAGSRNFNWIKLKRSYKGEMTDTLDLCIVGYFFGKGARTKFGIGTILVAAYDKEEARFKTLSKIGTGFTEAELIALKGLLDPISIPEKPKTLDAKIVPDVWVVPKFVVTVTADEMTRSRSHTANQDADGVGLSLRFPRVKGFIRNDKGHEDSTTTAEIATLFLQQKRIQLKET